MSVTRPAAVILVLLVAAAASGCAGGSGQLTQSLSLPSLSPSQQADVASAPASTPAEAANSTVTPQNVPTEPATAIAVPGGDPTPIAMGGAVGSATELYEHVASGAMSCWFAVGGPLKKDFIYHATADSPSRGGKAEIVIHRRDPTQPNPRGVKSYRIDIEPTGEATATIKVENLKMADSVAASMADDVGRWAKGDQGCVGASTAAGWAPAPPEAAETPKSKTKKAKGKKSKLKAAQAQPPAKPQQ